MFYFLFLLLCSRNTVTYRTSTCLHEHEEFSLCGWRCPITCVNIRLLHSNMSLCSSKWECHVGCRCSAGYIRDEISKNCVLVQNCPVVLTMAVILLVCIVAAASAAPSASDGYRDWQQELLDRMELNKLQEGYPAKRSNYGSYVSPCAAAAAASAYAPVPVAPVPAYASASSYYGHAAYPTVHAHHGYAPVPVSSSPYAHRYYRMEDEPENEQEMMGMDMNQVNQVAFDHMPMARSSYGPAPIVNAGQSSGPVVGVFSNANVGGCSVPLLVSCTPSISHGQIAKTQPYYHNYNTGAYRDVEEVHHDHAEEHQEKAHVSSEHLPQHSKLIADKHQ